MGSFSTRLLQGSRRVNNERSRAGAALRPSLRPPRPAPRSATASSSVKSFAPNCRSTKWSPEDSRNRNVTRPAANPLRLPALEAGLEDAEQSNRWLRNPSEPIGTQRPRHLTAASGFFPRKSSADRGGACLSGSVESGKGEVRPAGLGSGEREPASRGSLACAVGVGRGFWESSGRAPAELELPRPALGAHDPGV